MAYRYLTDHLAGVCKAMVRGIAAVIIAALAVSWLLWAVAAAYVLLMVAGVA